MMHSARCLSCGGHSMKAGELRKQLFYTDKATEARQGHDCPKSKATEEEPGHKPR